MRRIVLTLTLVCGFCLAKAQAPPHVFTGPNGMVPHHAEMVGRMVDDVTFNGTDGKDITLSSYRGKPLLIDLWATWCAPCLVGLPSLSRIYEEAKGKGLVFISFDQDRDAERAVKYMALHHFDWRNFHDGERNVEKALQDDGLPLIVLLDANGNFVYFDFGGEDETALRRAIAGLGTEFASVATSDPDNADTKPDSQN